MKNILILILALPLPAAVACGGGSGERGLSEPYHISFETDGTEGPAFPSMSELIDSIEYVRPEYVADMPVGHVDYLCVGEDFLFVFDGDAGLFHYTRDGRFVRRVGHIGRGPGEYLTLSGLYVDRTEGTIHFVAYDRILRYDLATGKFTGEATITEADGGELMAGSGVNRFSPSVSGVAFVSRGNGFSLTTGAAHTDAWLALDIPSARVVHREPSAVYDMREIAATTVRLPQPMWLNTEGTMTTYESGADTMYAVGRDFSRTPRIVADLGPRKLKVPAVWQEDSGVMISDVKENGRYILFNVTDGMPLGPRRSERTMMSFDKTTGERAFAPAVDDWFFEGPANDIDGGGGTAHLWGYDDEAWYAQYDALLYGRKAHARTL